MNKKYLPSALILYLNYFIHGVGCSILGQAVIKEALAASWGVEAMAITAISAALGLGRLIALPFAGPLSDKLGRRISTAIGSGSYAIYLEMKKLLKALSAVCSEHVFLLSATEPFPMAVV